MQREIEDLLVAYIADRNREARLVQDLLAALAVGSVARQRMIEAVATAASEASAGIPQAPAAPSSAPARNVSELLSADISAAVAELRAAQGSTQSTH